MNELYETVQKMNFVVRAQEEHWQMQNNKSKRVTLFYVAINIQT